jgi:hypothetical protein
MARSRVSEIDVDAVPEPCRSCVFWEAGGPPGSEVPTRSQQAARVAKESWWQATALEWGPCAVGAWDADRLMGYSLVAPPHYLKGSARFRRVTEDALLLAVLWTAEDVDEEQVTGWLVETVLRLSVARNVRAVEAFGSPGGHPCVPDERLLQANGFELLRSGYPYRQYRIDLRQTARWREGVEEALIGVRRALNRGTLGRVPSMPASSVLPRVPARRGPQAPGLTIARL